MQKISIKPVDIIGTCPISLGLNDLIQIEEMKVLNPDQNNICFLAICQFPPMIWQLQAGKRIFSHSSCPGCSSSLKNENRVIFLLGHVDKWNLCLSISRYLRLIKQQGEPDKAKRLKLEAIEYQNSNDFDLALKRMNEAIKIIESLR